MDVLTKEQIMAQYPDEWVLIGNPELRGDNFVGPIVQKLLSGMVLYHSKDKREIAYKTQELVRGMERFACIYTGAVLKNRRFWL